MVPIAAMPLLREDAVRSGRMRFSFEMMETAEILMNAVYVSVKAYLVPWSAFTRFDSVDAVNRAYEGVEQYAGGPVQPFVQRETFNSATADDIKVYLGLHAKTGDTVTTAYHEAYNEIWNFRAKNRSPDLNLRALTAKNLAPAFWRHEQFRHIVPNFDQALVDGNVALNVVNTKLPVKGLGLKTSALGTGTGSVQIRESGGTTVTYSQTENTGTGVAIKTTAAPNAGGFPDVWAELAANGITVSLSNIELAKKTAAFAQLRTQYNELDDDYLINMLMDGLTIPEQALRQPILLGEETTIFGMSKRYASDAANLTESVVNGATQIEMSVATPRIPTGGIIMVVAEITPEQLFERQADPLYHYPVVPGVNAHTGANFPHYLRDTLDPEKVEAVPNRYIDVQHATPTGVFGYAPLNYRWNVNTPRIGGKFYRPGATDPFDEDRQRLWAVETVNPSLGTDFYLCTNMNTSVFVVTNQDPFECVTQGDLLIEGNTVMGPTLKESVDDYAKVLTHVDQSRLVKGATPADDVPAVGINQGD
ncbi:MULTISPECIES: hypothetical protein [unclassified Mesorhizobium]|uniref:hypothetical protein n=1 Tax=unclassified Mesorhizobium TaxID=325217 RepID=UPI000FC9FEA8|nr:MULTISPECIES: hypothetical protein [unclassified Mesorhizobium]RUW01427.1 hypothetical protein EOA49_11260 [Mesorhizobium sp. M1A.F.Ca.IN.020.04.1.1]RUW12024.1 hypothetical protein EOA53_11420 [Mesorhizobium sp. M1A.F.Ca.IN.020.03.1.1]